MIGRSFAYPWYSSRATVVSSRKSSWTKGFMGSSLRGPRGRDRLELRRQGVVDGEGDQVGEGADREQDGVARGHVARRLVGVEQLAGEPREEHAAERAGH